jgi:hypothetical protein
MTQEKWEAELIMVLRGEMVVKSPDLEIMDIGLPLFKAGLLGPLTSDPALMSQKPTRPQAQTRIGPA